MFSWVRPFIFVPPFCCGPEQAPVPGRSGPRVLQITLRDVQSWAHFVGVAVQRCGLQPWTAYLHGAAMVLLDGLALGTGLSAKDVEGVRRAAYDLLVGQVCVAGGKCAGCLVGGLCRR
jgi:hypothetical protein